MDWKTHYQTKPSQYEDSSFEKNDSLDNSIISSAKILKPINANYQQRNFSMEINKKSKILLHHFSPKEYCPLQVIRNHISRSQMYAKEHQISEIVKRSAYQFFNQQKSKLINTKKSHQYLLPKICMKSKQLYHSSTQNFQSTINQEDSDIKKTNNEGKYQKEKKAKLKKIKEVIKSFDGEQPVQEARRKFKLKCQAVYSKLTFNLPQKFQREKCFFDLTKEQVSQLYSKQQTVLKKPQEITQNMENIEKQKQDKKFKLLQMDSQLDFIQENQSIPLFLMERLSSSKDLLWTKQNSFVTDVPRIRMKNVLKNKIKHIV